MQLLELKKEIARGHRVSPQEALTLLREADVLDLAEMAHGKRLDLHPEPVVTFVVDRNINYTNGCVSACKFCAFFKEPDHPDAYIISGESLSQKIEETLTLGGTQILLQGGLNPHISLEDIEALIRFIKENFRIHLHGFSPPEILFFAEQASLSLEKTLARLIEAGLDSIPGGGAEILVDEIREAVSPRKYSSDQWLNVMEIAHTMGLKTTATMMFGHIESDAHIVSHLMKVREVQDRTQGFTAFIPWTFQPENTRIDCQTATGVKYLRVLALSRIVLDNVPNIQASWVTQGDKIAQVALTFGANDLGSTMIEENVVAAAGVRFRLPKEEMVRLIQDAGYQACQRDCFYGIVKCF